VESYWLNFGFSLVITLLQGLVLDPAKKAAYERVFLKIFSLIWVSFQSDERFRKVVGLPGESIL
jgi:hypothetical protein